MIRVADYIIYYIYNMGVKDIFMVSGGGIMHLTDAIYCHGKLNYICCQHEQAVAMAAEGYAHANENFGVALVTSGPGATNSITGVVGAWQDSTPCLVISGQSKRQQTVFNSGIQNLRQFGVQEVNILPIINSVTKYAVMVNEPCEIKYHLEKAIYMAKTERPGPVWLDIPLDVQGALVDPKSLKGFDPESEGFKTNNNKITENQVKEIFSLLKKSKRPVIIAGHGIRLAKAIEKFIQLVETINIPVVTPRLGIDLIATDHRLFVGRPGIKGTRAANFAVQNSDLLLCIGSRLSINVTGHEYTKFAREAKIIVVDIDDVEHKKQTIRIDKFIKKDALNFIETLLDLTKQERFRYNDNWPNVCNKWKNDYPVVLPQYKTELPVNTYYFTEKLSECLEHRDVIIIDSGSSSYVVSQSIKIKKGQRFIASGGLGSMGYALPASIGASVALGGKRVICITGDGSLQMNLQEMQTVVQYKLPIKIFIFNNNGYASIRSTQHSFFNDHFIGVDKESGVSLPDTLKVADLYGIKGIRITRPEDIEKNIKEVLNHKGPVICDIICNSSQPIIPTVYSIKKDDGSMISKPLEDMYPFLDRKEFLSNMVVKPCDE